MGINVSSSWTSALSKAASDVYKHSDASWNVNQTLENAYNYLKYGTLGPSCCTWNSSGDGSYTWSPSGTEYPSSPDCYGIEPPSGFNLSTSFSGSTGSLSLNNIGIPGLSGTVSADYCAKGSLKSGISASFSTPKIALNYSSHIYVGGNRINYTLGMDMTGNFTQQVLGGTDTQSHGVNVGASVGINTESWEIQAAINNAKNNMMNASITFKCNINNIFK